MNKRQKKKFKKKGYHRKCLGPDEIVIFGMRCRRIAPIKWIWEKSEVPQLTRDEIEESFKDFREWSARRCAAYKEFLKEDGDNNEQASEEEI